MPCYALSFHLDMCPLPNNTGMPRPAKPTECFAIRCKQKFLSLPVHLHTCNLDALLLAPFQTPTRRHSLTRISLEMSHPVSQITIFTTLPRGFLLEFHRAARSLSHPFPKGFSKPSLSRS
ncbi:hypothetical protein TNIN_3211 [Trichonephila inaurata madagascariensis]|uniref:Uncharacterized protein n=1 Tax=Trichonephila inaurata madagascariensis TaxID=2747483 RepID=A0A8X7C4D2_9ARAC|nr:hypothetical protein TNIN_3211 [Trichonephila inaurata madagascariensis]